MPVRAQSLAKRTNQSKWKELWSAQECVEPHHQPDPLQEAAVKDNVRRRTVGFPLSLLCLISASFMRKTSQNQRPVVAKLRSLG